MSEINKLLEIFNAEVGYLEKSKQAYQSNPSILDSKTDGAGSDNYTKYMRDMDNLNVYNGKKQRLCMVQSDLLIGVLYKHLE